MGAESAAGIARRELVVDAASRTRSSSQTQSDYLESLKALGTQELAKHTRLENFRFTPTDEVTVGKVVAASLPGTDIQAAARITSITLTSRRARTASLPRSEHLSSGEEHEACDIPPRRVTYSAEDVAAYLCTRTSGVYSRDSNFAVTVSGPREITVSPGLAWINYDDFKGISVCARERGTLTVPDADDMLPRIDRVVLQF